MFTSVAVTTPGSVSNQVVNKLKKPTIAENPSITVKTINGIHHNTEVLV